ncbi:hypothetical protein [Polaribacter sp. HL-MS24]|uniref:hypothetical protein n=1 Tax=Polaribacter sp. HL-MS24 TaxID=3077735 RepID=UPI0029342670|nr:hypothetical protein [Polaribacter sp. HL-MS24]WOC40134.1 hypothetical protein RRF69_11070 [Polaribacter sp. HL-MS24]
MIKGNLNSKDDLTILVNEKGIQNWEQLMNFVKNIPYGRNSNRTDFSLVIKENKGSYSSKHAFLSQIAKLNNIQEVKLILGIYKMNNSNTTGIGDELAKNSIEYIPEAHCYLKIDEKYLDLTTVDSDFLKLKNDILEEIEIKPEQVADFKVNFHRNYLKKWVVNSNQKMTFDEIWNIREQCIRNLSKQTSS